MTIMLYKSEESVSQNATTTWVNKLFVSGNLEPPDETAEYVIWCSAEYTCSAIDKTAEIRVLLDDNEVAFEAYTPPVANQVRVFNSMGLVHLVGGAHSIALAVRAATTPNKVRCRRARIMVMKH